MAIMPAVGKSARWVGSSLGMRKSLAFGTMGAAAVWGAGSAILDSDGPWGTVQEEMMGDRDAIRATIRSHAQMAFDRSDRWDIEGVNDRYYGVPVNVPGMAAKNRRSTGSTTPVSGDVVFGMYNLRR